MGNPENIATNSPRIPVRSIFMFPQIRQVWRSEEFAELRAKYYIKPIVGRIFGFLIGFILSALASYNWVYRIQFDTDWAMVFLLTVIAPGLLILIGTIIRTAPLTFGQHFRMMRDLLQRDKGSPETDSETYMIYTLAPVLLCLNVFTEAFDTFAGFFFGFVLIFLIELIPEPSTVDFSIESGLWLYFMVLAIAVPVAVLIPYVLAPSISLYSNVTRFNYAVIFSIIQTLAVLFLALILFVVGAFLLGIITPVSPAVPSLAFLFGVLIQLLFLYVVISAMVVYGRKIFLNLRSG
jgi:MFS family permease